MKPQGTQVKVINVQMAVNNFIPRFAIFVQKREVCASVFCYFKDRATTNLLRRVASLREGRYSLLAQG